MIAPLLNPYLDLYEILSQQRAELQLSMRKKLIWAYSWAVPSSEAIQLIASYSPLLELGAGTGYWAWLLSQAGAQVIATDIEPGQPPHWHPVASVGQESVKNHPEHSLFLCWPSFESPMAYKALQSYHGRTVIYVGEWLGRTADIGFHKTLSQNWKLEKELALPNWPGFVDRLYVFRRKTLN